VARWDQPLVFLAACPITTVFNPKLLPKQVREKTSKASKVKRPKEILKEHVWLNEVKQIALKRASLKI
jgi:hypothetical protein